MLRFLTIITLGLFLPSHLMAQSSSTDPCSCNVALVQNERIFDEHRVAALDYFESVSQDHYDRNRESLFSAFSAAFPVEGVPIDVSGSLDYERFQEKVRLLRQRKSLRTFGQHDVYIFEREVPRPAYDAWLRCKRTCNQRGVLDCWEVSSESRPPDLPLVSS